MLRWMVKPDGSSLTVQQRVERPSVYLDHWAIRKFSADMDLRERLVAAINRRGGTLLFSWLNLVEFLKVGDPTQATLAEQMLEAVLPRVFFIDSNPFEVIAREDELRPGAPQVPPQADDGVLRVFAELEPDGVGTFTARGLLDPIGQLNATRRGELVAGFDSLADTIIARVSALRDQYGSDPTFRRLVSRLPSSDGVRRGTRTVVRELLRGFQLDRSLRITRNHAIDFMHAAVPIAYADYVLLDKHWNDQVGRVRARFKQAQVTTPLAQTFAQPNDGIEQFLGRLEGESC